MAHNNLRRARTNTTELTYSKTLEDHAKTEAGRLFTIMQACGPTPPTIFQPGGDNGDCGQLQTFLSDPNVGDSYICPAAVKLW